MRAHHNRNQAAPQLPRVAWCDEACLVAEGAAVRDVLTGWNEFRAIILQSNLQKMRCRMRGHALFDMRNIFGSQRPQAAGFRY